MNDDTTNREDWNLISNNETDKIRGTLIDGGVNVVIARNLTSNSKRNTIVKVIIDYDANDGIAGTKDSRQLNSTINHGRSVKVTRLGENTLRNFPIEAICVVSESLNSTVLCIYDNYAAGQIQITTVHSKIQLQHHNNKMDDTIMILGGNQTITTPNRSIFLLVVKNELCYLEQRRPTVWEIKSLPRVVMVSVKSWDPTTYYSTNHSHNESNITGNNMLINNARFLDANSAMLDRFKQAIISETGEHWKYDKRKLLYKAGPSPYPNPTRPIGKLEASSTDVDNMDTINGER